MNANEALIEAARAALLHVPKGRQRSDQSERLDELLLGYHTACKLSRGKDAARSKHWRGVALEGEERLRMFIVELGGKLPKDEPCREGTTSPRGSPHQR
jgi:hypothetical protein